MDLKLHIKLTISYNGFIAYKADITKQLHKQMNQLQLNIINNSKYIQLSQ